MTDPDDPSRLSELSGPAGLREVLRGAQNDAGTDAQLARLSERLGPLLGPAAPVPVAPAPAGLTGAAKLGLAGLALIVAGGGAWLLSTTQSASPPPTAPSQPVVSERPAQPLPAPSPSPVQASPEGAPSTAARSDAALSPAKPSEKPTPPAQPSEAELLEQARAALKSDPARALQRANEHAARFPRGVLVQEREVLAIQALRKLGRSAEAERRTSAFVKAFPGSAFARKVNASP